MTWHELIDWLRARYRPKGRRHRQPFARFACASCGRIVAHSQTGIAHRHTCRRVA